MSGSATGWAHIVTTLVDDDYDDEIAYFRQFEQFKKYPSKELLI